MVLSVSFDPFIKYSIQLLIHCMTLSVCCYKLSFPFNVDLFYFQHLLKEDGLIFALFLHHSAGFILGLGVVGQLGGTGRHRAG